MARLSLPTSARLPSSVRVDPTNRAVQKALNRLSRASLLSLVLDWLDEKNLPLCPPLLRRPSEDDEDDEDDDDEYEGDFYPPARSLAELQDIYASMQRQHPGGSGSKREVVDRVVEGDWRYGLSLYQLAMADLQHLYDHPNSLKWTAFRVQRLKNTATIAEEEDEEGRRRRSAEYDAKSLVVPRFHPSTFLQNLQAEVPPDVKAHYNFDRPKGLPLLLLRVFVLDSPYSTSLAVAAATGSQNNSRSARGARASVTNFDAARTIYVAFPDASPHVYISAATAGGGGRTAAGSAAATETRSLRALVVDAIPKALSRPRERYALVPAGLSTRNLDALLHVRGAGRTNAAGGGWSVYATSAPPSASASLATATASSAADPRAAAAVAESPLNAALPLAPPTPPLSDADGNAGSGKNENDYDDGKTGLEGGGDGHNTAKKRHWWEQDPAEAQHERALKRARAAAQARFGDSARPADGKGVERLDVLLEDPFPDLGPPAQGETEEDDDDDGGAAQATKRRSTAELRFASAAADATDEDEDDGAGEEVASGGRKGWRPRVRLVLQGPHVFAGVRQLVEAAVFDPARLPAWLTGEDGVSVAVVRNGRVRALRGAVPGV